MTAGGWIIMLTSVSIVTAALVWCVYKVLSTPSETEKLHAFDRPTPDEEEGAGK